MNRREAIVAQLMAQTWFQASAPEIQELLLSLPGELSEEEKASKKPDQNCDGYLADLARRPEIGGGVRVLRILSVLIPPGRIFGIHTNIEVQNIANPKMVFAYQYFSWRQGPQSGAKGLVLIQGEGGQITHAVILAGYAFAPGADVSDLAGGFAEVNEKGVEGMLARFKAELCEELGVPNLKIAKVIPLGAYYPDRGMTNNKPEIFAAIIDASEAQRIPVGEYRNPDPHEMVSVPNIIPIAQFWGEDGIIARSEDGFLRNCFACLVVRGILKP